MEDFQDDHGAVHYLATHVDLQVARLGGRDFVVYKDGLDIVSARIGDHWNDPVQILQFSFVINESPNFLPLADAQVASGVKACAPVAVAARDRV